VIIAPMPFIIAGLGNPGEEYDNTRHNTGRIMLDIIRAELKADEFESDKKLNAHVSETKIKNEKVVLIAPDTFMNNSGKSIAPLVKNAKGAEKLLVIYDDFQLPIGRMKISYDKSSGGHNGLESVIKAVKTQAFPRLRIGTAPAKANGDAKIPHGEEKVEKFILGAFKDDELKIIKKLGKKAAEVIEIWIKEGRDKATGVANTQE
jgi:peptidyl-tRNA hydrolase, PTH1 family